MKSLDEILGGSPEVKPSLDSILGSAQPDVGAISNPPQVPMGSGSIVNGALSQVKPDVFGRDFQPSNPMGQSLSNIPEGQSQLLPSSTPDILGNYPSFETDKRGNFVKKPSFLKSVEMIGSGAMKGSLTFTANLLDYTDRRLQGIKGKAPSTISDAVDYWTNVVDKNKKEYPSSMASDVGQVGAEMISPIWGPVGKGLELAGQAGKFAGEMLPYGAKTIGKYLSSGVLGSESLALAGGQTYDPNNPGQEIMNQKGVENSLNNPLTTALPMGASFLSKWVGNANELTQANKNIPTFNRNLKDLKSPVKTLSDMFFGVLPALTSVGKQIAQTRDMGEILSKFVGTLSGKALSSNPEDLLGYTAKQVHGTLKSMDLKGDLIWEQVPKSNLMVDGSAVKQQAEEAISLINNSGIPGESLSKTNLTNISNKGNLKVEDAIKLQSQIGKASVNAFNMEGGVGIELGQQLLEVKKSILDHIQNSIPEEGKVALSAARQYTSDFHTLLSQSPLISQAVENETNAWGLVKALMGDIHSFNKVKGAFNEMSSVGQQSLVAAKIAEEVSKATKATRFNLDSFLANTEKFPNAIKNTDTYAALKGLQPYLSAMDQASKVGWWRQVAIGTAVVGATGVGAALAGAGGAALPLLSYGALTYIANRSPLKSLLGALTKDLPESTFNHIVGTVTKQLTKAGFLLDKDGVFKHIDDQEQTQ